MPTQTDKTTTMAGSEIPAASHRWLVFGTGLGIAVAGGSLEVVIVRSRPSGPAVVATTVIPDFGNRRAAEWGAELAGFLSAAGEQHLAATLIVAREEAIVRTLQLPGVSDKDIPAAIELQVDTLHPYGDEEVAWAWVRAGRGGVLVGLVRKACLDYYETLFSEAGIGLASVTFSPAAVHAALRIWRAAPASLLCFTERERTEVYGESEARPVFSAEFTLPAERALAAARAELRLAADFPARSLGDELPRAAGKPGEVPPLAYAAALTASATLVTKVANLLPRERRASSARGQYVLPSVLSGLLALGAIAAFLVVPAWEQRRSLAQLNDEIHGLEPAAARAQTLEKRVQAARLRMASLDELRRRPQADLDVLRELTRILTPPTWTSSIEIYPDSVVIAGETDQAAPLLKIVDSSPLFQNSEFALSVTRSGNGQTEQFRIKTLRRNRVGRTTP